MHISEGLVVQKLAGFSFFFEKFSVAQHCQKITPKYSFSNFIVVQLFFAGNDLKVKTKMGL